MASIEYNLCVVSKEIYINNFLIIIVEMIIIILTFAKIISRTGNLGLPCRISKDAGPQTAIR